MKHSETIGKLAEALSKAQGEMSNAAKDKDNPFFKSSYADLASVWGACREALSKNGLSVSQFVDTVEGKLILTSILLHMSGEWMSSEVSIVPVKNDPQGIGSAITYFRRYCLSALVGIAPAEDDGESAMGRGKQPQQIQSKPIPPRQLPPVPPKIEFKPPVEVPNHRLVEMKRIQEFQALLGISNEDLKAEIFREFQVAGAKEMSLEQLQSLVKMLQDDLNSRNSIDKEPVQDGQPSFAEFK
jgi:hypothetical protein